MTAPTELTGHTIGPVTILQKTGTRELQPDLLDSAGRLKVMPASYYAGTTRQERAIFGVETASYILPTTELVEWVKARIAGRTALEIGSGNGVLAEALGIRATDNHMQTMPQVAAFYAAAQQPTIKYGPNVERIAALAAIKRYKPQVVVSAWVTQLFDPNKPEVGGNMFGVHEQTIIDGCDEYIFIGNEKVHSGKSIWLQMHDIIYPEWLYSRAINGSREFIATWAKS